MSRANLSGSAARAMAVLFGIALPLMSLGAASAASESAAPSPFIQVGDLTLRADANPVRERAGWRTPRLILIGPENRDELPALQRIAPEVRFLEVNSHTSPAAVAEADASVGVCDVKYIQAASHLQWIQWMGAGVERCVEQPLIQQRQLLVTNMQRAAGSSMAEHVITMMLMLNRHMGYYYRLQQQRRWPVESETVPPMVDLKNETIVIVGLGGIGTEVARRAAAFGMHVIATRASGGGAPEYVSYVGTPDELPKLVADADFVINCAPLTAQTRGMFNAQLLGLMKPSTYFINVGRGASVVTADLKAALKSKRIAGAGLDVTDPEPLPASSELWRLPNVLITPHVSGESQQSTQARSAVLQENLRRYVAGDPMVSVVDLKRGY